MHNRGKRIVFVVDEAAQVPQGIFDVIEGALSDAGTERIFSIRSNTTRTEGPFFEAFHKHRARWKTYRVDGRESALTDKEQIAEYIEAYGEDSDFVRVRIRAEWPRVGDMNFISRAAVHEAMARQPISHLWEPLAMGVDVARYGSDASVIAFRQGMDACSIPWRKYRGVDTVTLAAECARLAEQYRVDAIFVDAVGVGGGVADLLRRAHRTVFEVNAGARAAGSALPFKCKNMRALMWATMRDAIDRGLALPDDDELEADLCNPQFGYDAAGALQLERKEDMRRRGLASPDAGDALALTFAFPLPAKSEHTRGLDDLLPDTRREEYNPYGPDAR